jgi:hypothetical protein
MIRYRFFLTSVVAGLTFALLAAASVAELRADDTGSLSGVVTNSIGARPIEGARINIYSPAGYIEMRALTNRTGHYAAVGLQPGAYLVFFSKDGMNQVEGHVEICPGAQSSLSVQLSSWCSLGCMGNPNSKTSPTSTTTVYLNGSWGVASSHCR